jgi:ATP-dependent DNA helicase DinG
VTSDGKEGFVGNGLKPFQTVGAVHEPPIYDAALHKFQTIVSELPGYEYRESQLEMVATIFRAINENSHAIVEAGTGSGKSFAYLYPLIETEKTAVVSTGTIALQEQILDKDIPFLKEAGKKDFTAVIAKGRNNYLCKQKLFELERTLFPGSPLKFELDLIIGELPEWDGDFATLPFQVSQELKREIESSSEDCIMSKCEFYRENQAPFYNARKKMAKADLIVTNHSLYFADVVSGGNVLPEHELVVFDEAHHLYNQAVHGLTISIGRYSLTKLLQKIQKRVSPVPESITRHIINAESRLFEWVFSFNKFIFRLFPDNGFVLNPIVMEILETLRNLENWLEYIPVNMSMFPDEFLQIKSNLHRENLLKQLDKLMKKWEFLIAGESYLDRVNWVEADNNRGYFEIKSAPLFIDKTLEEEIWLRKKAVLTSATIAVKDNFAYFKGQLGLKNAFELILPSPFNFSRQSALYIPNGVPDPNSENFLPASKKIIIETLDITQGRAFLLFSSWKNMENAYNLLARELIYPYRKQGDLTRKNLIEWFKNTPNSVLFATATFWEGIDVPGNSLSCVIIDKLPFSVPDDPVIQARVDYMKAHDLNWFTEFMLPEAIIRLRQGVGRLIRTKSDKGLLVILDNRIINKSYGRTVLKSLPPVTRLKDLREAEKFLNQ